MNDFRTILPPVRAPFSIAYADRLLLVGSCFTENMGKRLQEHKFQALTNPFGIVYNPVSMARSLDDLLLDQCPFAESDLFENAGLWHSWEHHGHFSRPDRKDIFSAFESHQPTAADVWNIRCFHAAQYQAGGGQQPQNAGRPV